MSDWTGDAAPGTPYWWEAAAPEPADDPMPKRCDVLVIGAGYAGLSAAIAAHECGAHVAVVDAGTPGHGASTRNGGMMGAHPRLGRGDLVARFGPKVAEALFAEAAPALAWVKGLIAREGIACDLQTSGRLQLAWSARDFEAQRAVARDVRAMSDVAVEIVARDRLGAEIKTGRYFGGLLLGEHCGLDPAKYHRGLLAAVLGAPSR